MASKISKHDDPTNVDLLHEILLHVPAMSLIRFKCVSKQWLAVISDPQFVSHHVRMNAKSPISGLYLFKETWDELKVLSLCGHAKPPSPAFLNNVGIEIEKPYGCRFAIADSCSGLLLCYFNKYPHRHLVCNPTTRKFNLLPEPGHIEANQHAEVLVFDPLKSPHYKVVFISWYTKQCQFDVYSSGTSSWKQIKRECLPMPSDVFASPCVYWEGAIHWMICNDEKDNFHCRFDVDAEKLEVIPLPRVPRIRNRHKISYFGVCGGRLLRIQDYKPSCMGFSILEMGKGCNSWTVKHDICLKSCFLESGHDSLSEHMSVVHIVEGQNEDVLEILLALGEKLYSYNIKSKMLSVLSQLSSIEPSFNFLTYEERVVHGDQFVERLAPV